MEVRDKTVRHSHRGGIYERNKLGGRLRDGRGYRNIIKSQNVPRKLPRFKRKWKMAIVEIW